MEKQETIIPYRTVLKGGVGEIIEKKSRFLATVQAVESEEDALAFIEAMKKKYWDATHNCFAYILGKRGEIMRASDDGEPSGTAGRPMLELLAGEELRNAAVVVTRYFGGTLLGTGGLVRAYTEAVKAGLAASEIVTMRYGCRLDITVDYTLLGKVQYLLEKSGLKPEEILYDTAVTFRILMPLEEKERLLESLREATAAKAAVQERGQLYYIDKIKK